MNASSLKLLSGLATQQSGKNSTGSAYNTILLSMQKGFQWNRFISQSTQLRTIVVSHVFPEKKVKSFKPKKEKKIEEPQEDPVKQAKKANLLAWIDKQKQFEHKRFERLHPVLTQRYKEFFNHIKF